MLKQIGVDFVTIDIELDENWDGKEKVRDYVNRLALEKAQAGRAKLDSKRDFAVIGADTAVVLDDRILGKANGEEEAIRMLRILSGRTHHVYSAVALVTKSAEDTRLNISRVCFRPLAENEIEAYCRSGEPLGKAGAYAIQGRAAGFIERLEGSYSGVMGLPLYETNELLKKYQVL